MQRKWYRSVLEKDIDAVNGWIAFLMIHTNVDIFHRIDREEGRQDTPHECRHAGELLDHCFTRKITHMAEQLRKVTCHPYLFDGAVRILLRYPLSYHFSHLYAGTWSTVYHR